MTFVNLLAFRHCLSWVNFMNKFYVLFASLGHFMNVYPWITDHLEPLYFFTLTVFTISSSLTNQTKMFTTKTKIQNVKSKSQIKTIWKVFFQSCIQSRSSFQSAHKYSNKLIKIGKQQSNEIYNYLHFGFSSFLRGKMFSQISREKLIIEQLEHAIKVFFVVPRRISLRLFIRQSGNKLSTNG